MEPLYIALPVREQRVPAGPDVTVGEGGSGPFGLRSGGVLKRKFIAGVDAVSPTRYHNRLAGDGAATKDVAAGGFQLRSDEVERKTNFRSGVDGLF